MTESTATAGEAVASVAEGTVEGVIIGTAVRSGVSFALGAAVRFGLPLAAAAAATPWILGGLAIVGITLLVLNWRQSYGSAARLLTGQGTNSDWHAVGAIFGGIIAGGSHRGIDPSKAAQDVLPGSLRRKFPGEHLNKSLNDIKKALESAAGAERKSLQTAKKLLEQVPRLMEKNK